MLTQSRTYWWARVSHTSCNLQLDVGLYFLGHLTFLNWVITPSERLPMVCITFQSLLRPLKNKRREIIG
ncbi:hypothetical protein KKH3_44490 [Pectobacterium actinidiae]|nr:hypothetical protein KKH3_44490 [Pectobacterium actinidiae]